MIEFHLVAYYKSVRGPEFSTLRNGQHVVYTNSKYNDLESFAKGIKKEMAEFSGPIAPIHMVPEAKKSNKGTSSLSPAEEKELFSMLYK